MEQSPTLIDELEPGIPEDVIDHFNRHLPRYTQREFKPVNPEDVMIIEHNDGLKSYALFDKKTYDTNNETEKLVYLVDCDENGDYLGHGEIRYNADSDEEFFKNKPFVGFTSTKPEYTRQGFGKKRLQTMNDLSLEYFGYQLYSDGLSNDNQARYVWESLVQDGSAELFEDHGYKARFRFIKD